MWYASILFDMVDKRHLRRDLKMLLALPSEEQSLEEGINALDDWSVFKSSGLQSDMSAKELDEIARVVKIFMHDKNPSHPIFDTPEEFLSQWRANNLADNQFDLAESQMIIDCIKNVIFDVMRFIAIDNRRPVELRRRYGYYRDHFSLALVISHIIFGFLDLRTFITNDLIFFSFCRLSIKEWAH